MAANSSAHHNSEETFFFLEVEEVTGGKGLMDRSVEQHHAFNPVMEAWTSDCMKKGASQKFDVAHFTKFIDGFAPRLIRHLAAEIQMLLVLDKYDTAGVKRGVPTL